MARKNVIGTNTKCKRRKMENLPFARQLSFRISKEVKVSPIHKRGRYPARILSIFTIINVFFPSSKSRENRIEKILQFYSFLTA